MQTSEYGRRLIALFESGAASEAQWGELVGAVLSATEKDSASVTEIHRGIGFDPVAAAQPATAVGAAA